jgi:hypothetical protein
MDGLDIAMRQGWSDRILEQEEQIRSEEETLAEIQRIQHSGEHQRHHFTTTK